MSHRDPRRRKPIRDKDPLDEIKDNVKNNAVLTSSRSKTKFKSSNSDEEVLVSESATFITSGSPRNETRNFGTNINQIYGQNLRRQSPELLSTFNLNRNNDISDDEEDREESSVIRSNEINRARNLGQKIRVPAYVPESKSYFNIKYNEGCREKTDTNCKQSSNATAKSRLSSKSKLNTSTSGSNNGMYILLALFISGLVLYFMINKTESVDIGTKTEVIDVNSESQVLNDVLSTFKNMKSKYKNQNRDLWIDAYSSIASLINQETKKPSIIVLLGNKSDPLECLARLIGNVSSKALKSDRLVLTPKEFEADMGSVIQTMRSHLKDNKAIIVSDLLNINVEALKAFHNLCDRINPLVEEAIYIITVIADDYYDNSNPLKYVENQLHKKLSGKMKEDAIQPLITRLTDGPILTVKPEPTVTDCSL